MAHELVGRKIVEVRRATQEELDLAFMDANHFPLVFVLDNGTKIIPSSDEEGNNAGAFFSIEGEEVFTLI